MKLFSSWVCPTDKYSRDFRTGKLKTILAIRDTAQRIGLKFPQLSCCVHLNQTCFKLGTELNWWFRTFETWKTELSRTPPPDVRIAEFFGRHTVTSQISNLMMRFHMIPIIDDNSIQNVQNSIRHKSRSMAWVFPKPGQNCCRICPITESYWLLTSGDLGNPSSFLMNC